MSCIVCFLFIVQSYIVFLKLPNNYPNFIISFENKWFQFCVNIGKLANKMEHKT